MITVIMSQREKRMRSQNILFCIALAVVLLVERVSGFSMNLGSAAKPLDKKKVAIVGGGGYLGSCIFGGLQRAGGLYETGIASAQASSPRCLTATAVGSKALNGVLALSYVLAQADESLVKLTDFTSVENLASRLGGFDAAIFGTQYTLEPRPVTSGSYETSPNSKTMEIYMDRPRSPTVQGVTDADYSWKVFENTVTACQQQGMQRMVVIETDSQLESTRKTTADYIRHLEASKIPFCYLKPLGDLQNFPEYTYAKGLQMELELRSLESTQETFSPIYREDLAALCVQSLLTLDWTSNQVYQVVGTDSSIPKKNPTTKKERLAVEQRAQRSWCVDSERLVALLKTTTLSAS